MNPDEAFLQFIHTIQQQFSILVLKGEKIPTALAVELAGMTVMEVTQVVRSFAKEISSLPSVEKAAFGLEDAQRKVAATGQLQAIVTPDQGVAAVQRARAKLRPGTPEMIAYSVYLMELCGSPIASLS